MKDQPLPMNSAVDLWPWVILNENGLPYSIRVLFAPGVVIYRFNLI